MGDKSKIEWTDATWNVVTGCTKISPGCANCYIERTPPFRIGGRTFVNGDIPLVYHHDRMLRPIEWKRPRRIFVNSLSDLFHENVEFSFIAQVYAVMAAAPQHVFQVLTKRADRALDFYDWMSDQGPSLQLADRWPVHKDAAIDVGFLRWPLSQVWMGMTCENRRWLQQRVDRLKCIPASVRWLSLEPLLEDVADTLDDVLADGRIRWVVAGYESGQRRRPTVITDTHHEWIRSIAQVCERRGVPFLFKQWGGLSAKSGGRELDGRTYDGYP